eukprot:CAMPEP_0171469078 /NCGR_PEP_ID=MMETSP0945-20130129/11034_1 /TAXON_ID=109269 /ORGANISM="Vaucheria litorea, Strain CCMP2940" /LENGTH=69 /DNA_ID=CAMNT_0011998081 /DNA_START=37 /DNA_END=242 /DNA_ORIENTATION=-
MTQSLRLSQFERPNGVKERDLSSVVVAVGPEGGWDEPFELELFSRHGFQTVTLGERVLRSDVAVVSLLT